MKSEQIVTNLNILTFYSVGIVIDTTNNKQLRDVMILYLFVGVIVLGLIVFVAASIMTIQKSNAEMQNLVK